MHDPIQLVTESIASFNEVFIYALAQTARDRPDQFPLPSTLLHSAGRIQASEYRHRGLTSICLAQARFAEAAPWAEAAVESASEGPNHLTDHWLGADDRVDLAHLLFMVAWQGVRCAPAFVRILFGMSNEVRDRFERLTTADLLPLVRSRSTWIQPRWPTRSDVWSSVLEEPTDGSFRPSSPTLRLLQACAIDSVPMRSSALLGSLEEDALSLHRSSRSNPSDRSPR